MDTGRAVRSVRRLHVARLTGWRLVVRLAPPGQHVSIVDALLEHGGFLDHAAAARADEGREDARVDPQLLGSGAVEIELLDDDFLPPAQLAPRQRPVAAGRR